MISLLQFDNLCEAFRTAAPEINHTVRVANIDQATKKLRDLKGAILLAVLPSADRSGRPGQATTLNSMLFFFLEKEKTGDVEELQQFERMRKAAEKAMLYVEEQSAEGIPLFRAYNPNVTTIDPENFSGFNGYSLTIQL